MVGADSWYTKSCLSREYRFGSFCWRCDAQNAEYSKNRHCEHSVDGKQKDAVVVGIRRRACRANRALGRGIAGTGKERVTHGLQLLSKGIWRHCTRRDDRCQRCGRFTIFITLFQIFESSAARFAGCQAPASSLCSALRNCVANRMAVHVTAITSATGSARYTAVV